MTTSRATGAVFISHSHQDDELVRDVARRLRDAGLKPFVDLTELPLGANWRKTVREQIRAADAVLILVTPAALKSAWTMTELGMAEGFERIIVPVTAGLKPRDLPGPLRTFRTVPFDQLDGAIKELSERLAVASNT